MKDRTGDEMNSYLKEVRNDIGLTIGRYLKDVRFREDPFTIYKVISGALAIELAHLIAIFHHDSDQLEQEARFTSEQLIKHAHNINILLSRDGA